MNPKRDQLLQQITTTLATDERFVAAWLRGSFGRGTEDDLSDLDLTVVVSDNHPELLTRLSQVAARTSPERLALFECFGKPAVIHENNWNAPEGGTFTVIVYDFAVIVDWVLIPQSIAQISPQSRLLFSHIDLPAAPAPPVPAPDPHGDYAAERIAFFWMMAAVVAKYHLRGDAVYFHSLFDMLHHTYEEAEAAIMGRTFVFLPGSRAPFAPTPDERDHALREICASMNHLQPNPAAVAVVETLLSSRTASDQ